MISATTQEERDLFKKLKSGSSGSVLCSFWAFLYSKFSAWLDLLAASWQHIWKYYLHIAKTSMGVLHALKYRIYDYKILLDSVA